MAHARFGLTYRLPIREATMTLTLTRPTPGTETARPRGNGRGPRAITLNTVEKILGLTVATATERYGLLTDREQQVAGLMADGKRNVQIAEELGISPKTLDIHRGNVMRKLEARTTAQVANVVNLIRLASS
jgi:DNA-binding CsgD family transcriptional regulator